MEEAVGESSRDLLVNVQSCARELLKAKIKNHMKFEQKHECDKQELSRLVTLKRLVDCSRCDF